MSDNTIALVTGGGRGLGRNMAEHLTSANVDVIATYRRGRREADEVTARIEAAGGRIVFLELDLLELGTFSSFADAVRRTLAEEFDGRPLDALVNNAGIGIFAPYPDTTEEQFDQLVRVNLKAPYFLTQHLLPLLRDGGRILNVTTALTRGVVPGGSAYAATKGAVEVLTRYLAVELADRGILVNSLMGGAVETDFGGGIMHSEEVRQSAAQAIALGRIGNAVDMTAVVPAVLSDAFRWATGGIIDVSGGQSL